MDLATIWFRHDRLIKIIAANVVGLAVIAGGAALLYRIAVGHEVPNPETATPEQMVDFLCENNIAGALPAQDRQPYMHKVIEQFRPVERRVQFLEEINRRSDMEILRLQKNLTNVAIEQAVTDAQEYERLTNDRERRQFIESRIKEWDDFHNMVTGKDLEGTLGKERAAKMDARGSRLSRHVPTSPQGAYKRFVQETNPGERAKLETYVNDVQKVVEQKRKLARGD